MLIAIRLLTAEQLRSLACHCYGSFVLYYWNAQWSRDWVFSPVLMLCTWGVESQGVRLLCSTKWGGFPLRISNAGTWSRGPEHHNPMTWAFVLEVSDFRSNLWPEPERTMIFLPWLLSVFISHQVIGWFWKKNQKITFLIDKKFYIQSEKSVLSTLKNINNFLKL